MNADKKTAFSLLQLAFAMLIGVAIVIIYLEFDWEWPTRKEAAPVAEEPITTPAITPVKASTPLLTLTETPAVVDASQQDRQIPSTPQRTPQKKLPALNQSDDYFRTHIQSFFASPPAFVQQWVHGSELIRNAVSLIDAASQGYIVDKMRRMRKFSEDFVVTEEGEGIKKRYYMSAYSYYRYNDFANRIAGMDPHHIANTFHLLQPLLEKAYQEIGAPEGNISSAVIQALDQVLTAPVIYGKIELTRSSVLYQYKDRRLETASDIHKQMLRMGAENTEKIQRKVSEIKKLIIR